MSRRQRRKSSRSAPKKSNKSKASNSRAKRGLRWKILFGIIFLLVAVGIVIYQKTMTFLHSEEFRKQIALEVGAEMGTKGEFQEFNWNGMSLSTDGYNAEGEGAIQKVNIEDVKLDVDFSYIKRDKFKLKNVKVQNMSVSIDLEKDFIQFEGEKRKKSLLEELLPDHAELYDAEVENMQMNVVTSGESYSFEHLAAKVKKSDDGYDLEVEGGTFDLPLSIVEDVNLKSATLKQRGEEVYLNQSEFSIFDSGKLNITGFVNLSRSARDLYELDGKLSDLRCKDVFPANWQKNLKGEVVATFSVKPDRNNEPIIKGHLEIENGTLEALPVLNKVAYYLADSKYRTIQFETFECDFEKRGEVITLKNIILSSKGLLKVEGNLEIDGEKLDGRFDIGLPANKLTNIPGAETIVFKAGKDKLHWATVNIGGVIGDIKEDLTDRLIAAAGRRMVEGALEMGGALLKPEMREKIMDAPSDVLDIIDGEKSLKDGLNGLLNFNKKKTTEKEDQTEEEDDKQKEEEEENKGLFPKLPSIPDVIPNPFF